MLSSKKFFLTLVRLGIGHTAGAYVNSVNWSEVRALAKRQGLEALVLDGVDRLPESRRPQKETLLQWIGEVLQGFEYRYKLYHRTIGEMASFYNKHGYKMMIIKGFACGIDWPKPEHRPYGDIDSWMFGRQKESDVLVEKEKGVKIDYSHHHHTTFMWNDFLVENHYDFLNIYHHKSNVDLEKIFKELGKDDTHTINVYGEKVYLPSPNLHALFLLKHSMTDFAAFSVSLRQVLDWAFFVEKHTREIDWNWLLGILEKYHMRAFFNTINAICVEDLGFEARIFPYVQFNPFLKDRVLSDVLDPKFSRESPVWILPRLIYKFRRWRGNIWKHKMCYNESLWSGFWSGIINHFLKPASI